MDGEQAAFLAAIREQPEDDLRRLVYADWLDDHAGVVACGECCGEGWHRKHGPVQFAPGDRCRTCDGTGRVSNGLAERAEFIRVQIELAKLQPRKCQFECKGEGPPGPLWCSTCGHDPKCCNCDLGEQRWPFRRRERELFELYKCEWFGERTAIHHLPNEWEGSDQYADLTVSLVARGFVAEVRGPLAVLVGGECVDCDGYGVRGGWVGDGIQTPVDFEEYDCPHCHGTGHANGVLPAIVAEHPVGRVDFHSSVPHHNTFGDFMWSMVSPEHDGSPPSPCRIPSVLVERMRQDRRKKHESLTWVAFESEAVARDVLSDVAVAWAKDEASRASTGQGDISEVRS